MAPLTLRDFLELACQSSSDGFRSYPRCLPCHDRGALAPVHLLIEADLRRSPSRSPSSFFPKSPGALAKISHLSRSLSRRLREGFWRRREDEEDIAFDERDSLGLPSPVVSSCSASESSEYAESDTDLVTEDKSASASVSEEKTSSSSSTGSLEGKGNTTAAAAAGDGQKAVDGEPVGRNLETEDKQQLSPVSVMDFPLDDDDGEEGIDAGTCSPSFQQCLADLERSKAQLLHKIRRFEGLAQVVDPVDLEVRFTASESGQSDDTHTGRGAHPRSNSVTDSATTAPPRSDDHQSINQEERGPDEHCLLGRLLKDTATWVVIDEISEQLLLDFFTEGVDRLRALAGSVVGTVKPLDDHPESALVRAAKEWVQGAGPQWGVGDVMFAGEAALADMERGRRWMCVGEEERDVGAAVEELVMDGLVRELVSDLAACSDGSQ